MVYLVSRTLIVAIKPLLILWLAHSGDLGKLLASDVALAFSIAAVTTTLFSMCAYKWRFHLTMGPKKNGPGTALRVRFLYLNSIYVSSAVLFLVSLAIGFGIRPDWVYALGLALLQISELLNSEDTRDILYSGATRRWAINLLLRQLGYGLAGAMVLLPGQANLASIGLVSLLVAVIVSAATGGRVSDLAWRFSTRQPAPIGKTRDPFRRLRRYSLDTLGATSTKLTANVDKMLFYYFDSGLLWQYSILSYIGSVIPLGFDTFRMALNRSRYLQAGSFYRTAKGIPIMLADVIYITGFTLLAYTVFWGMVYVKIIPIEMHWLFLSLLLFNSAFCVYVLLSEKLFWTRQSGGAYGIVEMSGAVVLAIASLLAAFFHLGAGVVTIPMLLALQVKLIIAWKYAK